MKEGEHQAFHVLPFWLTSGAWGGGGGCCHSPSLNLNHCLFDLCLFLSYTCRSILGLPEYKLTVVSIFEMHGTGGLEVVVFE